jgi:uncharacterized protein GlcG (DUF336 family)
MLTLAVATEIIDEALTEARRRGFAPLAVAVLDAGGHLIAYKREDGAGIVRFDIAFITTLTSISGGRMVPSPGGVLILDADGQVLGAIGISGDIGDNDEIAALAGITKAGLVPAS